MRNRVLRRCQAVIAASVLAFAVAGCGADKDSGDGLDVVRYGLPTSTPTITTVGIFYAIDNGFFEKQGIKVEVTPYQGSTTAIRAMLSGDVDVVDAGGDTAFLARESGAPVKILNSPIQRVTDVFVARTGINSIADMKGKRFAISAPGDTIDVLGRILFQNNGVNPSDVQIVALGSPADRFRALLEGKIDATAGTILVLKPVLDAIAAGQLKVLAELGGTFAEIPLSYDIATENYIKGNRDLLVRFLRAHLEGLRWAQEHPKEAAAVALKHIPETELAVLEQGTAGMAQMKVYGLDGGVKEDGLTQTQDRLKQIGKIKTVGKATDVADLALVQEAVRLLGPTG